MPRFLKVKAAGVNRADLLQRAGKYPPPKGASSILGLEASGVVEQVGEGVTTFTLGEEVCALLTGGGYAERVAVPAVQLFSKPAVLSFEEAASIPEALITAYTNLIIEGGLVSGERVLIHGGSSGVGTTAIQLARAVGAEVACTVGSAAKAEACRKLGASLCVNYRERDFVEAVDRWSGGTGVDLVLDMVGADYLQKNLEVLATKGRLIIIAVMGGTRSEVDLSVLMRKRLKVVGSVLRSRSVEEKGELVRGFADRFLASVGRDLIPVVDSVFPLEQAGAAHERMRSSEHIGKIVLAI